MESTGLKTLNVLTTPIHLHLHLRSRSSLFRPLQFAQVYTKFSFFLCTRSAPLRSLPERDSCTSLNNGVGEAVSEASQNKVLQVVLVSPQAVQRVAVVISVLTRRMRVKFHQIMLSYGAAKQLMLEKLLRSTSRRLLKPPIELRNLKRSSTSLNSKHIAEAEVEAQKAVNEQLCA